MVNLWAGETHEPATDLPAGELNRRLAPDARQAVAAADARLGTDSGRG